MINNDDYKDCTEHFDNDAYITINPWHESQKFFFFNVKGLEGTPYEGGVFKFQIDLEDEYRAPPPKIKPDDYNFDENMYVADLKLKIMHDHKINPILAIQLLFKGKVLPDQLRLSQVGIDPKNDVITIMGTFAGRVRLWNKGRIWCKTLIWHPYIDCSIPSGEENIRLVGAWDSRAIEGLIEGIKALIHMQPPIFDTNDVSDPLNQDAGEQYLNHPISFDRKARKWGSRKHTRGRQRETHRQTMLPTTWARVIRSTKAPAEPQKVCSTPAT